MKIVGLCGEPGTGKTTVVRAIIQSMDLWCTGKFGTVEYLRNKRNNIIIMGKYDGDTFDGTDRLSMAVINDAERFLIANNYPHVRVLFEGDRLWCARFIQTCMTIGADFKFIRLFCSPVQFTNRHWERVRAGHGQDVKFIMSRKTKYDNLVRQFPFFERRVNNNFSNDLIVIVNEICTFLEWDNTEGKWQSE